MGKRDKLALERTDLAIDRTMLAYIRTFLAIIITGLSLISFFDSLALTVVGWLFIPVAFALLIFGVIRSKKTRDSERKLHLK